MHKVEARFRFLAADSASLLHGRRPSYRDTLLSIRDRCARVWACVCCFAALRPRRPLPLQVRCHHRRMIGGLGCPRDLGQAEPSLVRACLGLNH